MVLAMLLVPSLDVIAKTLMERLQPLQVTLGRFLSQTLILLPLFLLVKGKSWPSKGLQPVTAFETGSIVLLSECLSLIVVLKGIRDENEVWDEWGRALRPMACKLACHPIFCHTVSAKLRRKWSPEQIAGWLKRNGLGQIKDTVSISEGPASVEDRTELGHWEGEFGDECLNETQFSSLAETRSKLEG